MTSPVTEGTINQLNIVQPDSEPLKIIRLFLEKYELLAEEDRKLYRNLIAEIAYPPMLVTTDVKTVAPAKGIDWGSLTSNRHPHTGRSATGS